MPTSHLAEKQCEPCRGGVPPMDPAHAEELRRQLHTDWSIVESHHLARTFRFKDFAQALSFVNRIGAIAEQQGHHPDVHLSWGRVTVEVWTHKIDGLTESDFIYAAKCDEALAGAGS
jgi:4a-hydroxytetrahydrobiopterin dehydratase